MKDLINRLKRWLQGEDEDEMNHETESSHVPVMNRDLTIRTANIYPKKSMEREKPQRGTVRRVPPRQQPERKNADRFKFPLIPDDPVEVKRTPVSQSVTPVKKTEEPAAHRQIIKKESKRSFQPTEIISPIYGRKRPVIANQTANANVKYTEEKPGIPVRPTIAREGSVINPPIVHIPVSDTPHTRATHTSVQDTSVSDTPHTRAAHTPVQDTPVSNTSHTPIVDTPVMHAPVADTPVTVNAPLTHPPVVHTFPAPSETPGANEAEKDEMRPSLSSIRITEKFERVEFEHRQEDQADDDEMQSKVDEKELKERKAAGPFSMGSDYIPSYLSALSEQTNHQSYSPAPSFYRQNDSYSYSEKEQQEKEIRYEKPAASLLKNSPPLKQEKTDDVKRQEEVLATTLQNFNVNAEVIGAVQGPTVTRYEIQPAAGVKVNKITNLIDDIKLSLAARDIRIEAPIPGRSAVGIEVPNEESMPVYLRKILESPAFLSDKSPLTVALGVDIGGEPVVSDLSKMPHGLIAGATGSGKSVCINSIIISLLYKASPQEVRLLLVDPKMVELAPYNRLPHLITPVVTDPKQATAALKWAVQEMDGRYEKFAEAGARDISRYNELMRRNYPEEKDYILPSIVIIIDELADLMMVAPQDVEESICRIAQKARACGIHLLVATQRPSVDVITGLIKANIPTRVAFSVSSQTDSRTILDMNGAERLLGRGDMLYLSSGSSKPVRLQGPYVSDEEIEAVTEFVRSQGEPNYIFEKEDLNQVITMENSDGLFAEALLFCVENEQASASSLQRQFHIGYNRAARLIDMMEEKGFISGHSGSSKPRDVFLNRSDYEKLFSNESK